MGRARLVTYAPHLSRVYNTVNGKQKKCYKGSQGDEGSLLKVRNWGSRVKAAHTATHKAPLSVFSPARPPETCVLLGT